MRFARSKDESITCTDRRLPGFIADAALTGNYMIKFPLSGMGMVGIGRLSGCNTQDLDRERMPRASIARGAQPRASETSLPAPLNFPLGDVQVNSSNWSLLIFFMCGQFKLKPRSS